MRFEWTCDKYGRPVADGKGYIEVDDRRAREIQRARAKQRRIDEERSRREGWLRGSPMDPKGPVESDIKAWLKISGDTAWKVWHGRCDPHPNSTSYWFAVERCRTLEDLLNWNAHLSAKPWVGCTNWHRFIQRRLAPNAAMRAGRAE